MNIIKPTFLAVTLSLFAAASVQADHNSPWGEGWANMPNDIHNTRLDTRDGDNQDFIDFVRMGGGADSVNRFLDDGTDTGAGSGGSANAGGNGGGSRGGRS